MNTERALEIIGAFGGEPTRWPAAERAALVALAAREPRVAAAVAEAGELDGLLAAWAGDVVPRDFEPGASMPARGWQRYRGWLAGGVMAAAVATGLVVLAPRSAIAPTSIASGSPGASAVVAPLAGPEREGDSEAFATLFTTTADEDELI